MTRARGHIPELSAHKSGAAFVKIAGQHVWLGRYGDPLAQEKYDRLVAFVAEWLAGGRRLPGAREASADTVTALVDLARPLRRAAGSGEVQPPRWPAPGW